MSSTIECEGWQKKIEYCAGEDMISGTGKITYPFGRVYQGDIIGGNQMATARWSTIIGELCVKDSGRRV